MAFPKEIESLIFKGFLTVKAKIGDTEVVLKTVNENEHDLISLLSSNSREKLFYLLAFSVYLFDRENVLITPRDEKIEMLYNFFKKLRGSIISPILRAVDGLNQKVISSLKDARRFVYNDISRMRWPSAKALGVNSSSFTGITGTENLGVNIHQQIWYASNTYEDTKEYTEVAWGLIKFLIRVQLKKQDFNKLENSDKRRKKEEEEFKQRLLSGKSDGPRSKDSKEALYEEVQKTIVRGEKDEHDLFIANYEKQLKEQAFKRDLELKALRERFKHEFNLEDDGDIVGEARAATEEEVQKLLKPRGMPAAKSKMPDLAEKLSAQMANLDPETIQRLTQEHAAKQQEKDLEDDFFVDSSVKLSDEEINNQLLKVEPGSAEYQDLVRKLRKRSILKL